MIYRDHERIAVVEQLLDGLRADCSDDQLEDLPRIQSFLSQRVGASPHVGLLSRSVREVTTRLAGGLSKGPAA